MKITFSDLAIPTSGAVIAFATDGGDLMPSAVALDEATGGALAKAIKDRPSRGKQGKACSFWHRPIPIFRASSCSGLAKEANLT